MGRLGNAEAPSHGLPNVAPTALHGVLVQHGTMLHVATHGATRQVPIRPHRGTEAWHLRPDLPKKEACTPVKACAALAAAANVGEPPACKDLTMAKATSG